MNRSGLVARLEIAHVVCLSMWAGSLAMTATTAAIAFPTMKALDPTLPEYSAYPQDHWVIAAGQVMERVFTASDVAQLALGGLACALFIPIALSEQTSRPLLAARAVVLGALLASLLQYTFVMRAHMTSDLLSFWTAAKAGDLEAAQRARESFDAAHPLASARLTAHLVGVLVAIGLCAASSMTGRTTSDNEATDA